VFHLPSTARAYPHPFLIYLNLITLFSNIGAIMRNQTNPKQSVSNPPLPAVEPITKEQEAKSKELALIEARVKEALYPFNPRYKIFTASKGAGQQ
jgi:hypothetical protein